MVNVLLSLALFFLFQEMGWMPHVGIALATSVAGWVNAILLWGVLGTNGDFKADRRLMRSLPLIILSSLAMGAVLWFALPYLEPYLAASQPLLTRVAGLAALVAAGSIVFFTLVTLTGVLSPRQFRKMLSRSQA